MATKIEYQEIRQEIRHLIRRQWRVAIYVVCMILISGLVLRTAHNRSVALKEQRKAGVYGSVNAR